MKTNHLTQAALILSIAAFQPILSAQDTSAENAALVEKSKVLSNTLTTVIADSVTFSTLTRAIKAAGLEGTLGGKEMFTIFAPTDEAFGKLPSETLAKLMLPENKEKLRMLLLYHVVNGKFIAKELTDGEVKTVNGEKLSIDVSDDKTEVNGTKLFGKDVLAENGVMHVVGKVLVPDSLDGFVGLKN